jgi:serine/threonine protein kinase
VESLFREPAHDVQVVDFGVAKLIDPSKPVRMGTVIGTWLYMSPNNGPEPQTSTMRAPS